eukprot:12937484-Prorocentrum_lima.AAC.1
MDVSSKHWTHAGSWTVSTAIVLERWPGLVGVVLPTWHASVAVVLRTVLGALSPYDHGDVEHFLPRLEQLFGVR